MGQPTYAFWSSQAQIVSMSDDRHRLHSPHPGRRSANGRPTENLVATRGLWVNRRLPVDDRLWRILLLENRATRKISRKLIFGLLRRCVAFQRHYGGPWSILDETIWSLTSPLVKRISGSEKFRSSPKKTFATLSAQSGRAPNRSAMWHECTSAP